jgi:hypothetical protein
LVAAFLWGFFDRFATVAAVEVGASAVLGSSFWAAAAVLLVELLADTWLGTWAAFWAACAF